MQRKLREQGRKVKRSEEELNMLKRTQKEVDEMEALWKGMSEHITQMKSSVNMHLFHSRASQTSVVTLYKRSLNICAKWSRIQCNFDFCIGHPQLLQLTLGACSSGYYVLVCMQLFHKLSLWGNEMYQRNSKHLSPKQRKMLRKMREPRVLIRKT